MTLSTTVVAPRKQGLPRWLVISSVVLYCAVFWTVAIMIALWALGRAGH